MCRKTTHIKEKYANGYHHIDAGNIFLQLCNGEFYEFPSNLESKMNEIGLNEMRTRIKDRDNIVIELIGENYDVVEEVIELGKKLDYNTKVDYLECDMDKAWQRNIERGDDNISAHFCEPFHLLWFKQAAIENIKAIN